MPRHVEGSVDTWYQQATAGIRQGKTKARLLALVDQSGVGKSNLVLHLAEKYGGDAPVVVIPGSCTITDDRALERELVEAVSYPVDERTYHAKVYELCQIAQQKGYPFLVILDGLNENSDPRKMRSALEHLLTACQDYPLLVLITCRDAAWPLFQSATLSSFVAEGQREGVDNTVLPVGEFNEEEFERACERYFSSWNVNVTLTVEAAQRLRSPLLLRIFAEVYQHRPFSVVSAIAGKDLWSKYWETKVEVVYESLNRRLSRRAIRRALEQIAQRMLERDRSLLTLDELIDMSHIDPDDTSPQSLLLQLRNAAVLLEDSSEVIRFVYESFLEFVLGQALARSYGAESRRDEILARVRAIALGHRWHQVPLYLAELVSEKDAVIEQLRTANLWLAAQALRYAPSLVSASVRRQIIDDLVARLASRFPLDRRRAADFLGLLGALESKDALLCCRSTYGSDASLRALARLGLEAIVDPLIRHLGRFLEWHFSLDQELVNALPVGFRQRLLERACILLDDPEIMFAAAHTLGYLRSPQAVAPLLLHLETTGWGNEVALMTLLQIGTPEAFDVLERALAEIGEGLLRHDRHQRSDATQVDAQAEGPQSRDALYWTLTEVRVRGFQHCSVDVIVPFLKRLLEHSNGYVRQEAIQSLEHLGASETAFALVHSVLPESEIWLGRAISDALHAFGFQIDVEPFLILVTDPSTPPVLLPYAIEALGVSRDARALEPLSRFTTQRRFLFEAVQALGNSRLAGAVPILAQLLEDPEIDFSNQDFLNREFLDDLVIENLGKLSRPEAFAPVERFAQAHLPEIRFMKIEALAASGGERAIPLLRELWEPVPEKQKTIIRSLVWIGTPPASQAIIELLHPLDAGKAALLAKALMRGQGLDSITGTTHEVGALGSVDDRLVAVIDTYFEQMQPEDMWNAIIAMKCIATPPARQLLEHIATDPAYKIPFPNAAPGSYQTIREAAIGILCDLGSSTVIEAVLDTIPDLPLNLIEFRLAKTDPGEVRTSLMHRFSTASDNVFISLLTLLGTFGDYSVLADIRTYIDDPRQEVANAAYEAEQRILGLAYF